MSEADNQNVVATRQGGQVQGNRPGNAAPLTWQEREAGFKKFVFENAQKQLVATLGGDRGKAAAARVALAIAATLRSTKKPQDILDCTPESVINCVAMSALTGLMPSGPTPKVYLVPQRPRKDAPPELQWRITSRGYIELGRRSGVSIMAAAIDEKDRLKISIGRVVEHEQADVTAQPTWESMLGVAVVATNIADGSTICCPWVPRQTIEERRAKSRNDGDGSIWSQWPVEMAIGAAIRWCFARGFIPCEGAELEAAIEEDDKAHTPTVIEATATVTSTPAPSETPAPTRRATRGAARSQEPEPRQIAERAPDYGAEQEGQRERERVPVGQQAGDDPPM